MNNTPPVFPQQASDYAVQVDLLYLALIGMSVFFLVLIGFLLAYFAIRYRKSAKVDRTYTKTENTPLEITWVIAATVIAVGIFAWAAYLFLQYATAPQTGMEILVTGKQWMWKMQQPNGKREINELHIPVGKPVTLTMTSEDVIHSFFVPAFRVKKDVLPGKFTTLSFTPTKAGVYDIFCAEYCGTEHSLMKGVLYVQSEADYDAWLRTGVTAESSPAVVGERVFTRMGCAACHQPVATARGPSLHGLFGSQVPLQNGQSVLADEEYLRESIMNPAAKLVSGYPNLMPTYQNQLAQEDLMSLIAYLKSLKTESMVTADATP